MIGTYSLCRENTSAPGQLVRANLVNVWRCLKTRSIGRIPPNTLPAQHLAATARKKWLFQWAGPTVAILSPSGPTVCCRNCNCRDEACGGLNPASEKQRLSTPYGAISELWSFAISMNRRARATSEEQQRVQVFVRDNNVEQALRILKRKMQREGVFREMRRRRFYEKPSDRATREKAEAVRRARKLARKQAIREGLIAAPAKKPADRRAPQSPPPQPRRDA